jgi:hypothetical protein
MSQWLDFHDASIVGIQRCGGDVLLFIESVFIGGMNSPRDSWRNEDGTLRLSNVGDIQIDHAPASDIAMEGSDACIIELKFKDGCVDAPRGMDRPAGLLVSLLPDRMRRN